MSGRGAVINWGRIVQKRAKKGLFAGKTTHFGNRVSEDGGNKSRRMWKPNAHRKRLYSETLDEMIPLNVTTNALRWIDRAGGLDNYVLNTPPPETTVHLGDGASRAYPRGKKRGGNGGAPAV